MNSSCGILIVDDDTGFLDVIARILKAKGFRPKTASSAAQAKEQIRSESYDIAVVDISLPDADGTELVPILLKEKPDLIAVVLTGHSSVNNAVRSLNSGAFAYLEKPLDPDQLLSVVSRGIEKQRLVRENARLVVELENRNKETGILLKVSQVVSQSLDIQHIIDSALAEVVASFNVDASHIHLVENGKLALKGLILRDEYSDGPKHLDPLKDAISRVFASGKPVVISNRPPPESQSACPAAKFACYAGVALTRAGETAGVLGMGTFEHRAFTDRDVELLTGIGRELSIAAQNAFLYEEASSAKALRQLDAFRTELLANVSHELRTPLAVIKGSASTLLEPDVSFDLNTSKDFIRTIDEESDRLNRLIEDLLTMSKIETGTLRIVRQSRHFREIIDPIRARLDNLASVHTLIIDIPETLPEVNVDEFRIGQVVTNLVENAAKFSPPNSEIRITCHFVEDKVIVQIKDQGVGIPADYLHKVFERFFQINRGGPARKGTGLGLSICQAIIEAHGGKIWADSGPGTGSTFSFSLPAT